MLMYTAYMALVVSFVLVIVLNAFFVRRLSGLRDRGTAVKDEHKRLRAEMVELSTVVDELSRGKDSNAISIQALEREIVEIRGRIRQFLAEHPELAAEYGQPDDAAEAGPVADGQTGPSEGETGAAGGTGE